MIGPGSMPSRPRPLGRKPHARYTYAYKRPRTRRVAKRARIDHDPTVLFDVGPAELPVATLVAVPWRKRNRFALAAAALERWVAGRCSWLRPRAIPVAVAFVGMLLVLGSVKHLSRLARGDDQVAMQAPCVHGTAHAHAGVAVSIRTAAPDTGLGMRVTPPSLFRLSPLAAQAVPASALR